MFNKIGQRVALRDAAASCIMVFVIASGAGYVIYQSATNALKSEVQSNLVALAQSASGLLDGDAHQQITQPEDKGSELYENTRAPFFKLLKANSNIAFIYTAIEKDGKIYFILDASIPKPGEDPDTSAVMEEYTDATDMMKQAFAERASKVEEEPYTDNWGTFLSGYAPIYNSKHEFLGLVGADIRLTDYLAQLAKITNAFVIGISVAGLASLIVGWMVFIVRIKAIRAEALSHKQREEMREMENRRLIEEQQQKQDAEAHSRAQLNQLADGFEASVMRVVQEVRGSIDRLQTDAADVKHIAQQTQDNVALASSVATRANEASSQVAAAAEELTASIREISLQTQRSKLIATDAAGKAEHAKHSIEVLTEKSSRVGQIVEMITTIAGQINLLALNATIESARAGEAGKGFAVVASEVKNLANEVSKATDEITLQISAMQSATQSSVDSVISIVDIIGQMTQGTSAVAAAVEEQSAVTNEIARNIATTSSSVQEIGGSMVPVQEGAGHTIETAQEVANAVKILDEQSITLKNRVDEFLVKVRHS